MTYSYEKITDDFGNEIIKRTDAEGAVAWIPAIDGNSDYQRYLRWLENPDADESETL